jgi:hypothetical protein
LFPFFFFDFFCSASSLKKMMDYLLRHLLAWHSRSGGFAFRGFMTVRGSPRSHGSTVDTREKDFVVPQD